MVLLFLSEQLGPPNPFATNRSACVKKPAKKKEALGPGAAGLGPGARGRGLYGWGLRTNSAFYVELKLA